MKKNLLILLTLNIIGLQIFAQCYKIIPNNANVVSSSLTVNGGFTPQWICPGDTLHSDGGIMFIFIEPGSVMTTGGGIDTIFVRSGGTLIMNGGIHTIFFEPGAILLVTGGIPYYDTCVAMIFDYSTAPPNGCITGVNTQNKNDVSVSLFPNPSKGKFNISIGDGQNANVEIYNVLNQKVFDTGVFTSKTEIELEQASGIYFYRVLDREKIISSGKLIIE